MKNHSQFASQKFNPRAIPGKKIATQKKSHRFRNCCLIPLGIFLFLVLIVIPSLVAALGIIKVPLLSKIFYHSERPRVIASQNNESAKESVRLKFESIQKKEGSPLEVRIKEQDLNAYLRSKIMSQTELVQEPVILLHNNELEIWALIKKSILEADLKVVAQVKIVKNQPRFTLEQVKLGRISMPESVLKSLEEKINQELKNSLHQDQDVAIKKIIVKEDQLIIVGKTK